MDFPHRRTLMRADSDIVAGGGNSGGSNRYPRTCAYLVIAGVLVALTIISIFLRGPNGTPLWQEIVVGAAIVISLFMAIRSYIAERSIVRRSDSTTRDHDLRKLY